MNTTRTPGTILTPAELSDSELAQVAADLTEVIERLIASAMELPMASQAWEHNYNRRSIARATLAKVQREQAHRAGVVFDVEPSQEALAGAWDRIIAALNSGRETGLALPGYAAAMGAFNERDAAGFEQALADIEQALA